MIETLTYLDEQILLFFNGNHTAWMDEIVLFITGKFTWIPFYIILVEMLFRRLERRDAILTLVAVTLAIVMTDQICASLIRPYVARLRPCNPDNPFSQFITLVHGHRSGSYGWPSCHAANTFALATLLSCVWKSRKFTAFIFSWATIVSMSRLYMGVHYPTDLLCGAAFGSVFGYLALVITYRCYNAAPRLYYSLRDNNIIPRT